MHPIGLSSADVTSIVFSVGYRVEGAAVHYNANETTLGREPIAFLQIVVGDELAYVLPSEFNFSCHGDCLSRCG